MSSKRFKKSNEKTLDKIEKTISLDWYSAVTNQQLKTLIKTYQLPFTGLKTLECIKVLREHRHIQIEQEHLQCLSTTTLKQPLHFFSQVGTVLLLTIASFLNNLDVVSLARGCKFLCHRLSLSINGIPSVFMVSKLNKLHLDFRSVKDRKRIMQSILARCFRLTRLNLTKIFPTNCGTRPFILIESSLREFSCDQIHKTFCSIIHKLKGCNRLERLSITNIAICWIERKEHVNKDFVKETVPWFPHLKYLCIEEDSMTACDYFKNWHRHVPNLTWLKAHDGIHFQSKHFPHLQILDLRECNVIFETTFDLGSCTKLHCLFLNGEMTKQLTQLPSQLEMLFIEGPMQIELFKQTPNLQHVSMRHVHVDDIFHDTNVQIIKGWFTMAFASWKQLKTLQFSTMQDYDLKSIEVAVNCAVAGFCKPFFPPFSLRTVRICTNASAIYEKEQQQLEKLVSFTQVYTTHKQYDLELEVGKFKRSFPMGGPAVPPCPPC